MAAEIGLLALQVTASAFALFGTWLVRRPGRLMPWGFVCWLVSNPCVMVFMAIQGHWVLFVQHFVFLLLAIEGAWNWLAAPALQRLFPPSTP